MAELRQWLRGILSNGRIDLYIRPGLGHTLEPEQEPPDRAAQRDLTHEADISSRRLDVERVEPVLNDEPAQCLGRIEVDVWTWHRIGRRLTTQHARPEELEQIIELVWHFNGDHAA